MGYEIDKSKGSKELYEKIIKKLQIYESRCLKKNEASSPTQVKKIIEEMCHED